MSGHHRPELELQRARAQAAARDPVRHYFAFGSNMNPDRVRERGLSFDLVCGARLSGFRLVFDKSAPQHPDSGHANIAWAPGEVVEGVLYRLVDAMQIWHMDPFEQAPINYSREVVRVVTDAGSEVAWTYIANPARRRAGGKPERAYLAHLLAGRPWLSPAYHARLAAWPVVDPDD